MQNTYHGAASASSNEIDELLALLDSEPTFKSVGHLPAQPEKSIQEQGIETLLGLIRRRHSLHLRFSSGKDSTSCAVLVIEAVRRAVAEGITTTHYISSSSTGIENPAMEMHLMAVQDEMRTIFKRMSCRSKFTSPIHRSRRRLWWRRWAAARCPGSPKTANAGAALKTGNTRRGESSQLSFRQRPSSKRAAR